MGSLVYEHICTSRYGWGWKNYELEVNAGKGLKVPRWMKPYMTWVLPVIILIVLILSIF